MRVIAGTRRHLLLKTPEGLAVRPTTDRTKETLFNILQPYLADCRFLDLFSGSGAIAIEALSRGAREAVLVEQAAEALACIRENVKTTKFTEQARILPMDVQRAIRQLEAEHKKFDIIFMDPPYHQGLEQQVLSLLASSELLEEDTWIIIEAALKTDFSYLDKFGLEIFREKCYKNNEHIFIQKKQKEPA